MSPDFFYIIILVLTGIGIGFTIGLLGIGGSILVPILYLLLLTLGVESTLAIRMAFGTSLAILFFTAVSSVYGHRRIHKILPKAVIFPGVSGFMGGIIGGHIATHIPGDLLKIIFALVLLLVALIVLLFKEPIEERKPSENILLFLLIGFIAGLMSGLVGIGAGVFLVPAMVILLGFSMGEASGTSSAVVVLISLGGIISYIFNGLNTSGLPPYSLGYINLLQLVIIIGFSIPMAQIGAWASHRLPEKYLRYTFAILLVYISLRMLGVFQWLKLPL